MLVRESRGLLADRGRQLVQEAETRVRAAPRVQTIPRASTPVEYMREPARTPADAYRAVAEPIMGQYGSTIDCSRLDWMVCKRLASTSLTIDQAYLEEAILVGSPGMEERKVGHTADYARRTAEKVMRDPEVVADRERLTQIATAQRELGVTE